MPLPDSAGGTGDYQSVPDFSQHAPSPDDNGASVTVPIPGGGDVTVQGPDSATEPRIPAMPGANWGSGQIDPNSPNVSPMGVAPAEPQ